MQHLMNTPQDERNEIVNALPIQAPRALLNILRFTLASENDGEEDPEDYWHP